MSVYCDSGMMSRYILTVQTWFWHAVQIHWTYTFAWCRTTIYIIIRQNESSHGTTIDFNKLKRARTKSTGPHKADGNTSWFNVSIRKHTEEVRDYVLTCICESGCIHKWYMHAWFCFHGMAIGRRTYKQSVLQLDRILSLFIIRSLWGPPI